MARVAEIRGQARFPGYAALRAAGDRIAAMNPLRGLRRPKRACLLAAVALCGPALARPALACSCVPASVGAQYGEATDVLLVTAVAGPEGAPADQKPPDGGVAAGGTSTRQVNYTLEVKEAFKGGAAKRLVV